MYLIWEFPDDGEFIPHWVVDESLGFDVDQDGLGAVGLGDDLLDAGVVSDR